MPYCSFCGTELAAEVRFCADCGKPVSKSKSTPNTDDVATIEIEYEATSTSPLRPYPPSSSSRRSASRPSISAEYLVSEGRFLPGRLIAGRYRIIALLGKGGMGEVYRADDLTLGQGVAIKFLPQEASSHEGMLERFKNEVRIARRVSHPNVCRVYDVGEVDGATFFTMEYVDGEDLASLLRRIGRLPQDKAVEIARQICAGLAAAHAKGVLHRDLKPANIMLDGRGQVVITDFGLAGLSDDIRGPEVSSGTPAYMAPEQIEGREVTMLSDIYALGLVLYEIFTGKRAFAEKTVGVQRGSDNRIPSRPSSVVKDIDPIVEKVIIRCLETEPASRPGNAFAVSAALPGGDPLAAALAAGETPSPEMVAAAGETAGLRRPVAIACLVAILIGLSTGTYLTIRYSAVEKIHPDQPPEVLVHKAREFIAAAGYPDKPFDSAFAFDYDTDYLNAVEKEPSPHNWEQVLAARPTPLLFWYRQSPKSLFANEYRDFLLIPNVVAEEDPATTLSGMINAKLDARGRLVYLEAIPPQKDVGAAKAAAPDWKPLFTAADLDVSKLQTADPQWTSLGSADVHTAWTGVWPGTNRPLRVEAAAWRGKPVFFALVGDWNKPWRMVSAPGADSTKNKINQIIGIALVMSLLVCGALVARWNYKQGRADRDGALRLAAVMFSLEFLLVLFRSHFVMDFDLFGLLLRTIASGLFVAGTMWVIYLAVEPWIRRRWPRAIISWTRLISGQLRDPLVGRDILLGVVLGVVWILIFEVSYIPLAHVGAIPPTNATAYLLGGRQAIGQWLLQVPVSLLITLQLFFLALALKVVFRKDWLAAIVFVAIYVGQRALQSSHLSIDMPAFFLVYAVLVLVIFRFGLVPLAVGAFTVDMLANVPFTSDLSAWYSSTTILALLSVIALGAWGFYHSLGGQSTWKREME